MANNNKTDRNFISQRVDAVKKWWDSDTTKAISTIIAVLLIPGAVLAWNYASGRNVNVDENILEGESTSNENESEDVTEENAMIEEEAVTEENVMIEENKAEEESTELEIGGINQVTTLPNTSSK